MVASFTREPAQAIPPFTGTLCSNLSANCGPGLIRQAHPALHNGPYQLMNGNHVRLILMRHGESEWQAGATEDKDSNLSASGRIQARALAIRIAYMIKDAQRAYTIYTSPMRRSIQTAEALGKPFTIVEKMREANGDLQAHLPRSASANDHRRRSMATGFYYNFRANISDVLGSLISRSIANSSDAYVYCHGGVIKTMLRIIHDNDLICYKVANCSVSSITWDGRRWFVDFLNDCRHL